MPDHPIFTLQSPRDQRTNGDVVSGVVNLDLARALEKDVEKVRVSLRGEIHTYVVTHETDDNTHITTSNTHRERVRLINDEVILWTPSGNTGGEGVLNLPFSFRLPHDPGLPPAFEGGDTDKSGGAVKYYIHAVAERRSWYQRNTRLNQAFPFLPLDYSPAPYVILPNWPGEWQTFRAEEKMRRGIISHHGLVETEFSMPSLPAIPLFRPIPVRIRVICTSKPMSESAANDPDKFEFPRNPALHEVELTLRQNAHVVVGKHKGDTEEDIGLVGGFGEPKDKTLRETWGKHVNVAVGEPSWAADGHKNEGHWREEIIFSSLVTFRCSPPFTAQNISSALFFDLVVHFPGMGNKIKQTIGPLLLTSGIAPPQSIPAPNQWGPLPSGVTMPEPFTNASDGMNLPQSYYSVIHAYDDTPDKD